MEKKFIGAGLVSGLIAGIVAFIFARIFIEPQVGKAIDYEEGRSHAEARLTGEHAHEHEVFSRSVQENIGAGVGTVVFALCMGAFFAVAFTVLWAYLGRRNPAVDPRIVAAALAAVGFVAVYLVPFAAYPANPPAIGLEGTIGSRSGAYLTITLLSVGFAIVAAALGLQLARRIGTAWSTLAAIVAYVAATIVAIALLPSYNELPTPLMDGYRIVYQGFPADVLANFRVYSLASQVILWAVLAVVFAAVLTWLGKRAHRTAAPELERIS